MSPIGWKQMVQNLKFRDAILAQRIMGKIRKLAKPMDLVKICHVCGTHEWTITHFGLRSLLPANIDVIAGPGCPVCIIPASEIDEAVQLALQGVVILSFGDVIRVPGSSLSLQDAKAKGADIRVIYSLIDAIKAAKKYPTQEFAFFAVGFETTAPSTALGLLSNPPKNLSFLISHRLVPPAMMLLAELEDLRLAGFIAPGHVSTIIGLKPYEIFPNKYGIPTVVAGFEPLDVLFGIYMILRQLTKGVFRLENEYVRAVKWEGNLKAQALLNQVFHVTNGKWRGLGTILESKLKLRDKFSQFSSHIKFDLTFKEGVDLQPGCKCHLVIIGKIKPSECPLFMNTCSPANPVGACMVGREGTCRILSNEFFRMI